MESKEIDLLILMSDYKTLIKNILILKETEQIIILGEQKAKIN
jgi:hypothetical protein